MGGIPRRTQALAANLQASALSERRGGDAVIIGWEGAAATAMADAAEAYAAALDEVAVRLLSGELEHPVCRRCGIEHW